MGAQKHIRDGKLVLTIPLLLLCWSDLLIIVDISHLFHVELQEILRSVCSFQLYPCYCVAIGGMCSDSILSLELNHQHPPMPVISRYTQSLLVPEREGWGFRSKTRSVGWE